MFKNGISKLDAPLVSTGLAALILFLGLFALASNAPLTFDEGFNANVALSLAEGLGYATHVGGDVFPFNPLISTGSLYIAPFSLALILAGPGITTVHLYSLAVTFFFFVVALLYSSRFHRYLPLMLLLMSAAFLFHGKSDLVPGSPITSIPEPPYGLWYQFLGNMAGAWAAIAAILAATAPGLRQSKHLPVLFLCAVFACNAKMIHALPLTVGLTTIFALAPRLQWRSLVTGLGGVFVGIKLDRLLAASTLNSADLQRHAEAARAFFRENLGFYVDFLNAPSAMVFRSIVENIGMNLREGVRYSGESLLMGMILLVGFSALILLRIKDLPNRGAFGRLLAALSVSSITVLLWWAGIPDAPVRFLTPVAPFAVGAAAVAFVVVCRGTTGWRRAAIGCATVYLLALTVVEHLPSLRAATELGEGVGREQRIAADISAQVAAKLPNRFLCGDGWWYPHEIVFLSGSPKTTRCGGTSPRLVVIPKHIFPGDVRAQLSTPGCRDVIRGAFYDVSVCGVGALD